MAKPAIAPGAELDGFTIRERVHQGGMATLWAVTHPGIMFRPSGECVLIDFGLSHHNQLPDRG
jgi:hypothetical protein